MELSPEIITALIVATTAFLTSIAGLFSKRNEAQRAELEQIRADYKRAREQLVLLDRWTFDMTRALSQRGIDIPNPPSGLQTYIGVDNGDSN